MAIVLACCFTPRLRHLRCRAALWHRHIDMPPPLICLATRYSDEAIIFTRAYIRHARLIRRLHFHADMALFAITYDVTSRRHRLFMRHDFFITRRADMIKIHLKHLFLDRMNDVTLLQNAAACFLLVPIRCHYASTWPGMFHIIYFIFRHAHFVTSAAMPIAGHILGIALPS